MKMKFVLHNLPCNYYLRYQPAGSTARTILRSELNDPLLIEHAFGNGTLMLNMLGASPGWSALPGSPLFGPACLSNGTLCCLSDLV